MGLPSVRPSSLRPPLRIPVDRVPSDRLARGVHAHEAELADLIVRAYIHSRNVVEGQPCSSMALFGRDGEPRDCIHQVAPARWLLPQHLPQIELGIQHSLVRGPSEKRNASGFVLLHPSSFGVPLGEVVLGFALPCCRGLLVPTHRLGFVHLYPFAIGIHACKVVLRGRVTAFRGAPVPACSLGQVLVHPFPMRQGERVPALSLGIAHLCGLAVHLGLEGLVPCPSLPVAAEAGETEKRPRLRSLVKDSRRPVGDARVPLLCFCIVAGGPFPILVELCEVHLRANVAVQGGAFRPAEAGRGIRLRSNTIPVQCAEQPLGLRDAACRGLSCPPECALPVFRPGGRYVLPSACDLGDTVPDLLLQQCLDLLQVQVRELPRMSGRQQILRA